MPGSAEAVALESDSPASPPVSQAGTPRWWPGLPLAGVLGAALVIRVAMLASTLSRLDGDEAVTGIMAQRINEGHHLAFFAGQAYQGSGEQYLQALLFRVLPE